jgi:hypothetical protein
VVEKHFKECFVIGCNERIVERRVDYGLFQKAREPLCSVGVAEQINS